MEPTDIHLSADDLATALREDVRRGLGGAGRKELPPKWFYDDHGSALFERITHLPEYYPTRAETALLTRYAPEIAAASRADTLLELGSGSGRKTRLLLDALRDARTLRAFVPVDVSGAFLERAAARVAADYPGVRVRPVVADFERHLGLLPAGGRRLVAMLGSTIGNQSPGQRAGFLTALRAAMAPGDTLLLGADLVKDPARLVAAYDDAEGVTADFNRNVLRVVDRELDAGFDPEAFDHVARWDPGEEWVEMRLRSRFEQQVAVKALDLEVRFDRGEEMRTEISAKFRPAGFDAELVRGGFAPGHWWSGADGDFALVLTAPV